MTKPVLMITIKGVTCSYGVDALRYIPHTDHPTESDLNESQQVMEALQAQLCQLLAKRAASIIPVAGSLCSQVLAMRQELDAVQKQLAKLQPHPQQEPVKPWEIVPGVIGGTVQSCGDGKRFQVLYAEMRQAQGMADQLWLQLRPLPDPTPAACPFWDVAVGYLLIAPCAQKILSACSHNTEYFNFTGLSDPTIQVVREGDTQVYTVLDTRWEGRGTDKPSDPFLLVRKAEQPSGVWVNARPFGRIIPFLRKVL